MSYLDLLRLTAPEGVLVATTLVLLAIGLASARAKTLCSSIAAIGIVVAIGAVVMLPATANLPGGMLVITPLTSLFKIVCLGLAFFTVLLIPSDHTLRNHGEYLAIMLLATLGLLLLVGSEEFLMIFVGLELLGLSLYVMAAFDKSSIHSAEAGLKYFLFGSTASAFTLFGISLVYGMTGTTSLGPIAPQLIAGPVTPLLAAGIVMTIIGFAFKIAAAPFHLWAPDAYQGAPVSSAAFIASGSKVASFVALGKILLLGFGPAHGSAEPMELVAGWAPIIGALAAFSILLGNLVALVQSNMRRLLAYSAVAHAGYTLLGLVVGTRNGFSATLFYTTTYAITLVGAFGVVGWVRRQTGGDDLSNFSGLVTRSPLLAGCMSIFLLSLAGLPPLAGFFGKFYLFATALQTSEARGLLWLVALALLGSLISLYYYLMVLKLIFLGEPANSMEQSTPASISSGFLPRITIAVLAGAVLLLGLVPAKLVTPILTALP